MHIPVEMTQFDTPMITLSNGVLWEINATSGVGDVLNICVDKHIAFYDITRDLNIAFKYLDYSACDRKPSSCNYVIYCIMNCRITSYSLVGTVN